MEQDLQPMYPEIEEDLRRACVLSSRLHLPLSGQWASTAFFTFRTPGAVRRSDALAQCTLSESESLNFGTNSEMTGSSTSAVASAFKVPYLPPLVSITQPGSSSTGTSIDILGGSIMDPIYNAVSAAMVLERYKEAAGLAFPKVDACPVLRFLHYYAKCLYIERIQSYQSSSKTEMDVINNAHFKKVFEKLRVEISEDLGKIRNQTRTNGTNGALHFLHGKILKAQGKTAEAKTAFQWSIASEPLIVEVWLELAECVENRAQVIELFKSYKNHWQRYLFSGRAYCRLGLTDLALKDFGELQKLGFADNPNIKNEVGKLIMTMDTQQALALMESTRRYNPYRLSDIDSYSNLLFIMDDHIRMRILADEIYESGRFTPECSIALGNFYGLIGDHEKAVMNFSKALKYDPDLHHVWTLIGHEYVELKQTELAMQSYSNAVEADPREYRAWYGLGQTLEILRAHASALYYFKRAFEYCPSDTRMLLALGDTFQILECYTDAEMCYWRAYQIDGDPMVLVRFAKMFEKLGRYGRAAQMYVKYTADVQSITQESGAPMLADRDDAEDLGYAYLYLAKYYLLERLFEDAREEAEAAQNFREAKDEAHAMLKQISRMEAEAKEHPDDYKHALGDPRRLGFPLWKDFVVGSNQDSGEQIAGL